MVTVLTVLGGIVIGLAALSFLSYLLGSFFSIWSQFFPESPKINEIIKWNQCFTFLKTLCWQFTIYLFAVTSLLFIFFNYLG